MAVAEENLGFEHVLKGPSRNKNKKQQGRTTIWQYRRRNWGWNIY